MAEDERLRILVIDDEESVRLSLELHFQDCGFETLTAESAEEAMDHMNDFQPHAAVVDLRLPGIDGMEFIRWSAKEWPKMRYVIYTGSPAAQIPDDILTTSGVSKKMFFKPLENLSELSDQLLEITGRSS